MKYGFNYDYDETRYHAFDAMSSSQLKTIGNGTPWSKGSPMLYKYVKDHPEMRESKPAQKLGTLLHTMILEPHKFESRYIITDVNLTTKAGRALKEEAKQSGRTLIKEKDYELYQYIRANFYSNNDAKKLMANGLPEVSMLWEEPVYNLTCKGRIDWLALDDNHIIDLKTTSDDNPTSWQRAARFWQYNIQAAFYAQGFEMLTGVMPKFTFIAVQTVAPYETSVHETDEHFLTEGIEYITDALELYNKCKNSGNWPGHANGIMPLTASDYYFNNLLTGKESRNASGNVR